MTILIFCGDTYPSAGNIEFSIVRAVAIFKITDSSAINRKQLK